MLTMTTRRPKILDLFAGQGGAGVGYHRAGADVYAVDIAPQPRNPFPFLQLDALTVLRLLLAGARLPFIGPDGTVEVLGLDDFDAIHASPPCQPYTIATAGNLKARAKYQRLIPAVRELLILTGRPWVIENVELARSQMQDPVLLCGRMFGLVAEDEDGLPLVLDRHRLFESNVPLLAPAHPKHGAEQVAGVYGGSRHAKRLPGESLAEVAPRDRHAARFERGGGYVPRSIRVQKELLGIDWMTVKGMQESIPPVYSEHIGMQLLASLSLELAA